MALDKRNRFLLQTTETGQRHIYIWRPQLAQRQDMRPISYAQAVEIEKELVKEAEDRKYARFDYDPRITDDNPVIEEAVETELPDDDIKEKALKLAVTNEDLLKDELRKLSEFQGVDSLEEYFLIKYRIELTTTEDLAAMQKEAAQTLASLANANKLYEVKK